MRIQSEKAFHIESSTILSSRLQQIFYNILAMLVILTILEISVILGISVIVGILAILMIFWYLQVSYLQSNAKQAFFIDV